MQKKELICALQVLINSQYASNMNANKQLVNSENWSLKLNCYQKSYRPPVLNSSVYRKKSVQKVKNVHVLLIHYGMKLYRLLYYGYREAKMSQCSFN